MMMQEANTMQKKVLVISVFPPVNAPEADYGYNFCLNLARRGIHVEVLTTVGSLLVDHPSCKVYPLLRGWKWSSLKTISGFFKRTSVDAVILLYLGWVYGEHPMITFVPTLSKRLLANVPVITQFAGTHGAFPSFTARLLRRGIVHWAGRRNLDYNFGALLRDSDHFIFLSDHHQFYLAEKFPEIHQKSLLLPPPPIIRVLEDSSGGNRCLGRQRMGLGAKEDVISFFGYSYPGKGIETLLRAFQIVSRQRENLRLAIIGGVTGLSFEGYNSYAEDMKRLACELEIRDRVIWTGSFPSNSDIPSIYLQATDICVLPFDQGLSLNNSSFSAAIAHGLPIISTSRPNMSPQFSHGENVYLCPPRNPDSLAAGIELLLTDHQVRERISKGGRQLSQKWYSWEWTINGVLSVINN